MAGKRGFSESGAESYLLQLRIQNELLEIYSNLYNKNLDLETAKSHIQKLHSIYQDCKLSCLEEGAPAPDILRARLRANYWGALARIYRPMIMQTLSYNHHLSRDSFDMVLYAECGVRALVESTRAYHGVEERPFIITNPFSPAHA